MRLTANIICIKWGSRYNAQDVNYLYNMVRRNLKETSLAFYCFTDNADGLNEQIISKPLPQMNCDLSEVKYVYRKEASLCADDLGGLAGQRVLYFDLDVIITGQLDCFISYPSGDEFVITRDWNVKKQGIGQASCYSWKVGTLGYIKEYFEKHPRQVIQQFRTGSQEYLSAKVIEKWGALNYWPEEWCRSFKVHALPPWYLRLFLRPKLPQGTRVLVFHGQPKIDDAIAGIWDPAGVPIYKKVYKTVRPTPWLAQYREV